MKQSMYAALYRQFKGFSSIVFSLCDLYLLRWLQNWSPTVLLTWLGRKASFCSLPGKLRHTHAHCLSPSGPSLASGQEDTSWRLGNSCHLWRDLNPVGSWAEPIVLEPGVCLLLDNVLIWRQDCFFFSAPFLPPSPLPSPHTPTPHNPYFHHGAHSLAQNSYCIKSDKWMKECHYLASEESSLIFFSLGCLELDCHSPFCLFHYSLKAQTQFRL